MVWIDDDLSLLEILANFPLEIFPEVEKFLHLILGFMVVENAIIDDHKIAQFPSTSSTAFKTEISPSRFFFQFDGSNFVKLTIFILYELSEPIHFINAFALHYLMKSLLGL